MVEHFQVQIEHVSPTMDLGRFTWWKISRHADDQGASYHGGDF